MADVVGEAVGPPGRHPGSLLRDSNHGKVVETRQGRAGVQVWQIRAKSRVKRPRKLAAARPNQRGSPGDLTTAVASPTRNSTTDSAFNYVLVALYV
jgi:hypothetical protein